LRQRHLKTSGQDSGCLSFKHGSRHSRCFYGVFSQRHKRTARKLFSGAGNLFLCKKSLLGLSVPCSQIKEHLNMTNHKNTASFVAQMDVLLGAAVGVIIVQTREPHRTQQVLREQAFAGRTTFRVWDCVYGWREFPDTPKGQIKQEKILDGYEALRRITDLDGDGGKNWDNSMLVMHYTHYTIQQFLPFNQLLKHYVRMFAESQQRLIMLVPEGFTPPTEIANDVTLVDFPLPDTDELRDSLNNVIRASFPEGADATVYEGEQLATLVANASGMTQLEAENAFGQCIVTHKKTWPHTPFDDFNTVLLDCKTSVVKRSEVLEMMTPVPMDQVGGLDLFKKYMLKRKRAFSPEAQEAGVDVPKGILTVGPPGTGKSLCSKMVAWVLGLPLVKLDIGKVFAGIVGQSEERIRSALKQLEAMAPCVVLLDEIDKGLGGAHQAGGDSGVSQRVLGTILTHMQECTAPIYWNFTANRVTVLPPELIRKGRLDDSFCVSLPNIRERMEVLCIHLKKRKQNPAKIAGLERVAVKSKGYVSAEIEAAVKEAALAAFHEDRAVTADDILDALGNMKPLAEAFKADFDAMMAWAVDNARMTSTPEEEPGSLVRKGAEGDGRPGKPQRRSINTSNN
jgi:AAA+ superfamily predicted ATPase